MKQTGSRKLSRFFVQHKGVIFLDIEELKFFILLSHLHIIQDARYFLTLATLSQSVL